MSWLRAHRVDVGLVALVLACAAPIVQELKTQQASRLALTAAIWDDGTVRIDDYPVGVDRAERDGHVYSDKAPGQPFFAIPAYAVYRLAGGEPATRLRLEGNLGLWAVTLWSSVLPMAALLLLVRRAAADVDPRVATTVAVVVYASTLLLPFSSVLFGHVLGTCLAFAAWFALRRPDPSDRALLAAGFLLGTAVLTEYTFVLVAAAVGVHAVWSCGPRAWRLVAGGAPAAAALLAYQWVAFGSPFAFSYASSSFGHAARELGDQDQQPALWSNALRVVAGERGLAVVTPIVVLAAVGAVVLVRRRHGHERRAYATALASAAAAVGVQVLWSNPTGGDSPGARYATSAAAFLAPGLALAWSRWPRLARVLAAFGALVMLAATWTDPLEARDSSGAIGIWLDQLVAGRWALSVYEMALGGWAKVLLPIGAILALGILAAGHPRTAPPVTVEGQG